MVLVGKAMENSKPPKFHPRKGLLQTKNFHPPITKNSGAFYKTPVHNRSCLKNGTVLVSKQTGE